MVRVINEFRDVLRQFEREVEFQNNNCCQSGVSLAQCHALLDIEGFAPTTITDIANRSGLDKSTVSRTIDGLFNIGLINRNENPGNRRESLITLTEDGLKTCKKINRTNNRYYKETFSGMSKEEVKIFIETLRKISERMMKLRVSENDPNCYN